MNRIDTIIHDIRSELSKVAEDFDSTTNDLIEFLGVADEKSYNSVVDSFYLLEDTELAKQEFEKVNFLTESFGILYLFFYGVLNSCYMQQQALLVICEKLGIEKNIDEIKNSEIIAFRNDFSAHSPNRGRKNSEHSFILDRHAMREGKVKGYSANHNDGLIFRESDILLLIKNWNSLLERQLELIASKILPIT